MTKFLGGMFVIAMAAALGIGAAPQASAAVAPVVDDVSVDASETTALTPCIPSVCKGEGGYCCHPTVCCVR